MLLSILCTTASQGLSKTSLGSWALSLPNSFTLLLVSSLVLLIVALWINSLPGFFSLFCAISTYFTVSLSAGWYFPGAPQTTRVTSDTISVTLGHIGIIIFCYMLHYAQLNTLAASTAGNEPDPRAAYGNSSISHKHPTGMCPSLIPKMLGNLFSHRADKHQLLTHSEQHPGLEQEQGAGWQQWRQTLWGASNTVWAEGPERGSPWAHPERCVQLRAPQVKEHVKVLECLQRRATQLLCNHISSFCFPSRPFLSIKINQT